MMLSLREMATNAVSVGQPGLQKFIWRALHGVRKALNIISRFVKLVILKDMIMF
jgi:hypothetical protein